MPETRGAVPFRYSWRNLAADAALTAAVTVPIIGGRGGHAARGQWSDLIAVVATLALLMLRRRFPIPAFAAGIVATLAVTAAVDRPTSLLPAMIVLLFTVSSKFERRRAIAAGVVTMLALMAMIAMLVVEGSQGPEILAGLAWPALAVAAGDIVRSRQVAATAAIAVAEERARTDERLRIARELHDVVAHRIAVVNVQAGVAAHLLRSQPDGAEQALAVVRSSARAVLDELGGILSVLRASDGELPLAPAPLLESLPALVDSFAAAGLTVTCQTSGAERPLPDSVQLAIHRTAQEALTNAHKHGDSTARLAVDHRPDGVEIIVENPVVEGNPAGRAGFGLIGMRERVEAARGTLEAGAVGRSFRVRAWFPVPPVDSPRRQP